MAYRLSNPNLEIRVDHPLENYQNTRFDWTGKITDLYYRGIPLLGAERKAEKASDFPGRGCYNEFGIEQAVGYEELQPGGWFHKIGVGLLQKPDNPYDFAYPYKMKPLSFQVEERKESLTIKLDGPLVNGYAYRLEKAIRLKEHGFVIDYLLINTGSKKIVTDEYNHNFLRLGEAPIDEHYHLSFNFPLQPGIRGEAVNPDGAIDFLKKGIQLKCIPKQPFFYSFLNGDAKVPAQWTLVNHSVRLGIRETGSFASSKVNLWGWRGAISPELFMPIRLPSGKSLRWQRDYGIFETH